MNKHFTAGLIFFLGISISITTFWTVNHQLNSHKNLEFKWTASEHYRAFHKQLERDIYALELHKILDIFQLDKKSDFTKFSQLILQQHKSIQSLYWFPAVTIKGELDISPANNNPDGNNSTLTAMSHSEAINSYFFTLNNTPGFRSYFHSILEQTRDSGKLMTTKLSHSNSEAHSKNGIIAISPVYNPHKAITSIAQKKKQLLGFVVGVVLFDDLFRVSIGHLEPRGIDIYLLNSHTENNEQQLYYYRSRISRTNATSEHQLNHNLKDDTLQLEKSFTITGQNWLFIGKATPEFRSAEAFNEGPVIALITGIVFTIFLVLYFYHLSQAKDAWQIAERKLHTILDNSPDYIIISDRHSVISYLNKPLFDLEPGNAIGQSFFDWLPKEYHKRYKKGLKKAFKKETADFFNYSLADSSHWEVRILPIRSKNRITSAMIIFTDITKQHNLQLKTTENARLASIGVLATGIAHEINNPNNSIYFNACLMQDSWNDILPILDEYSSDNGDFSMGGLPFSQTREKIIYASKSTIEHTSRIKKIVATLKSFARKDSGEINEDVQLSDVIGEALLIINNEVRKHTEHLLVDLPNNLPEVKGNSQKLEQVFINIILNGLHALPDRDKTITISGIHDKINNKVIISIHDEGIGIDEACLDKITQPFYTTKPDNIGTGLGLSISSSIIKEHNGKLFIESQPDKGTTVSISIPVTTNHSEQQSSM